MRPSVTWPLPLVASLMLVGCGDPFADKNADSDTDQVVDGGAVTIPGTPVAVDQCTETYSIPGPGGTVLATTPDAHADVFGAEEDIGSGALVSPEPLHVHLGFPGADTSNSVSFTWTTDTGTLATVVQIGEGADLAADALPWKIEGASFRYGGGSGDLYRVHEAKVCGRLTPGTTYTYRVGGEGHWSPTYTFTTPAAPGTTETWTAVISGDSRGSFEQWGQLVDAMVAEDPDIFLFSGDMVQFGVAQAEWYAWFEATGDAFAEHFFVPAHGNHEALATNYFALFSLPGNEQWFSIDFNNATIASLNDTVPDFPGDIEFDQSAFMEDKLGASTAQWKMAMHHQPTYSSCTTHGSREDIRDWWAPVFDETGVDFVFSGHNHIYERSYPLKAGAQVPANQGTTYLVTGGAGAPLYENTDDQGFTAVANPIEHYILAEFDSTGVTMTVKDINGNTIDSFVVPK